MITKNTWINGIKSGLRTTWQLGKIVFPITLVVTILQHTPLLELIVSFFAPIMKWFGLPGDAAIALTLGNLLNLYAGIGAILTMDLTVKEVFILSVMLSFSHSLPIETAVASKIGVKAWLMALIRLSLAFVSALLINWLWKGGQTMAQYGMMPGKQAPEIDRWSDIALSGIQTSLWGILQIAAIIIPLMIAIELLKDIRALPYLAKALTPLTRLLGVSEKTSFTLMAGLTFGLVSGAGVMIQAAQEEDLSKRDLYLISIFLVACHAVVEDTLIFIPLGVNILPLFLIRFIVALIITILVANIWKKIEDNNAQRAA
ncbi:hypothetical protein BEP19_15300 [Ammoniphilus oxalaticus]|uniref:Nucleoside transporter/FeoB GTPase Gate domain-containing protein n=1 Tax=Ammoniphilus oxalaticus TaxID=66863 RepID=A0A419SD77_9BACL|nr:nucleoside recognition domain-containing protein [Ammoniphilus oxalaticus]RKD21044.1 hypothetical protein BEP19_15300 [Ammoniphilus oxalaticus]